MLNFHPCYYVGSIYSNAFQTNFTMLATTMDPDMTAPKGAEQSDLSCIVCN